MEVVSVCVQCTAIEWPLEKKRINQNGGKIYQIKENNYPKGVRKRRKSTKRRVCSIPVVCVCVNLPRRSFRGAPQWHAFFKFTVFRIKTHFMYKIV